MDFDLSEEQASLRDLAARIFSDKATTERVTDIERRNERRIDDDLWQELARAQLLGVALPESHGGLGFGIVELLVVLEQQGRVVAPVPLLPTLVMGAAPLAEFGSPAQRDRWLPGVCAGRVHMTGAFAQPGANFSLTPTVHATKRDRTWHLSGTAIAVPAAHVADVVLVPARTDDGITVFVLERMQQGIHAAALETTARDVQCTLEFTDVRATDDAILGAPGDGEQIVQWTVDRIQLAAAALALGCCERALQITAEYVSQRVQFGRPLSTNQGVALRAADAYIDIDCMRVTLWQAAWRVAAGLPARDRIAIAKYWSAEGGQRVVHATQHLHGGMGADIDYPVHRYFLWVKQLENGFGGAPQQLARLGESIAVAAKSKRALSNRQG